MTVVNHELDKTGRLKPLFLASSNFVLRHKAGDPELRDLLVVVATLGSTSHDDLALIEQHGNEMRFGILHFSDQDAGRLIKGLFEATPDACGDELARDTFVKVFNHIKTKTDLIGLTDHQAGKRIKRIVRDMGSLEVGVFIQRLFSKCLETAPPVRTVAH